MRRHPSVQPLIFLSAGGTAVDVLGFIDDINDRELRFEPIGYLDDAAAKQGAVIYELPVLGKTRLLVTFPSSIEPPVALASDHEAATFFFDRRLPRTVFRREATMPAGAGRQVAEYSAWFRTDAPASVAVVLPAKVWGLDRLHLTLEPDVTKTIDISK